MQPSFSPVHFLHHFLHQLIDVWRCAGLDIPQSVVDQFTHEALSVLWVDATREVSPYFKRKAAFRTLSALAKSSMVCSPGKLGVQRRHLGVRCTGLVHRTLSGTGAVR